MGGKVNLFRSLVLLTIFGLIETSCVGSVRGVALTSEPNRSSPVTPRPAASTAYTAPLTLTVFAAASLTGAFQEIGANFESANPGVQVSFNFAGSQILRTQLEQGALADVFASADHKNMDALVADHLVESGSIQDFLTNSLTVILPSGNPGNVHRLADLARPGLKLVLADESVPAGNYARQALAKMSKVASNGADFSARVLANVVSNETDVKQVVAKVELGEADAGIVYASDAVAAPELKTITIPENINVVASYPIAVLIDAPDPNLAKAFVNYVTSPNGQAILTKWGFSPTDQ
jgi:molybdate transport system substrate-binding protein